MAHNHTASLQLLEAASAMPPSPVPDAAGMTCMGLLPDITPPATYWISNDMRTVCVCWSTGVFTWLPLS